MRTRPVLTPLAVHSVGCLAAGLIVLLVAPGTSRAQPASEERLACRQQVRLVGDSPWADSDHGTSLSLDGDSLIVGSPRDPEGGAAFVYLREPEGWRLQARLAPPEAGETDFGSSRFGEAVAIDGTLAVVGRPKSELAGRGSGSVHVFRRSGEDWTEVALLVPPDHAAHDRFGSAVALDGERIAVGALEDSGRSSDEAGTGAVHVFEPDGGGGWAHAARLVPASAEPRDHVGQSLSLSGDRLLVGAAVESTLWADRASATTFRFDGSAWVEEQRLSPPIPAEFSLFGWSVALHGDLALVGAPLHHEAFGAARGAAHVFVRGPSGWEHQAELEPGSFGTRVFGRGVALAPGPERRLAAVGDPGDRRNGSSSGAVLIYRREAGDWLPAAELLSLQGLPNEQLGEAVAMDAGTIAAGAPLQGSALPGQSSATLVFECVLLEVPLCEPEEQELPASGALPGEELGRSLALGGDLLVVGAPRGDGAAPGSGLARVYENSGGTWLELDPLVAPAAAAGGRFGHAVATDGVAIVVGASSAEAAWVFERCPGGFCEAVPLVVPGLLSGQGFAIAVDIDAGIAVVGAHRDSELGPAAGAAHVFVRGPAGWEHEARLVGSELDGTEQFGFAVAVSGETVLVGAHGEDDEHRGDSVGAAYFFERVAGEWREVQRILSPDGRGGDQFGISTALDGDTALIGSWGDGDWGSALAYVLRDGEWELEGKLIARDLAPGERLGTSLALSNGRAVLGDPWYEDGVPQGGSAHVFVRLEHPELGPPGRRGSWHETSVLRPSALEPIDRFGAAVAVSRDWIVAGAPLRDVHAPDAGGVEAFDCFLNRAPSSDAGPELLEACEDEVELSGYASDADGDAITLRWSSSCPELEIVPDEGVLDPLAVVADGEPCGADCVVTLTVEDEHGATSSDSMRVVLGGALPPVVTPSVDDLWSLWAPNGRWVRFETREFSPEIIDGCGAAPPTWEFVDCLSDQPEDGLGDGHREPDCRVVDRGAAVELRVERSGLVLDGRRYSLVIVATDDCGKVSEPTPIGRILVPHDQRSSRAPPRSR